MAEKLLPMTRWNLCLLFLFLCSAFLYPAPAARAAHVLPTDLFDPTSTAWLSVRNMTGAAHQDFFNSSAAQGYLMIDSERIEIGGEVRHSSVWQYNSDNRSWVSRSNLTSEQFSDYWQQYADAGMRLIDQDAYPINGELHYAGIWMENKENLAWYSYRNQSNQHFSETFDRLSSAGYMIVDVEGYSSGDSLLYSSIWVKNTTGLSWVERRNMNATEYADYWQQYADAGMRVVDFASYTHNGQQYYAAIWLQNQGGRGWYSYRDMSAQQYSNRWYQLRDAGYRLIDFEIYNTPAGIRYAGVWRQNSDRPNWSLKDQVTALLEAHMETNDVAGMGVAIAVNGKFVYLRGFGHANIAQDRWFHSSTIARAASGCKAVAGALAMRLEERNLFDIDQSTRFYAPTLPVHHSHLVWQTLANRAGVRHYQDGGDPTGSVATQYNTALAAAGLFMNDPLVFAPGTDYGYSTHGYTLLGAAMEGALGDPIAEILRERLSDPFNLPTLRAEDRSVDNPLRAALYKGTNGGPVAVAADNISWKVLGGGCEVSPADYARLGIKLANGTILSQASLDRMWTRPDNQANYALGWDTGTEQGTKVVAKSGAQTGASSYIRIYPDEQIVIAIMSNQRGHSTGDLGRAIGALLLNEANATLNATPADGSTPEQAGAEESDPANEYGDLTIGMPQFAILPPTATDDPTEPTPEPEFAVASEVKIYLPMVVDRSSP
jgi:CubicO group peptidase (beta-lactamase class C family)